MNASKVNHLRPADHHLAQVVEPLANYICATAQPRAALAHVVAALQRQVEQTNRTAVVHFRGRPRV